MTTYNIIPAVDSNFNFPKPIADKLNALVRSLDIYPIRAAVAGEDSNSWKTNNTITVGSDSIAKSIIGAPPDSRMGTVRVFNIAGIVAQTWIEHYKTASQGTPRYWYRASSAIGPVTFSPWVDLTSSDISKTLSTLSNRIEEIRSSAQNGGDSGLSHSMMQSKFRRKRGGTIGTGGKAAVALRFDHGFSKFSPIIDLLRKYQLPATQACFYHQFDSEGAQYALNSGWTWSMIQNAGLNDGLEVANHSSTHKDATTSAAVFDEIVTSRQDLRSALPKLSIDGWITPGVGGTNYKEGWNTTPDLEKWATTEAGRLVLAHHAWAEGYTPGELHVLDGTIIPGRHSWTIDLLDRAAKVEELIQRAIETKTGINFMLHPANVGLLNMVDLNRVEAILSYIASERDAGRIEVLTLGGWMMADISSSNRLNLAPKYPSWNLGTASVNASSGNVTITGASIDYTLPLAHIEQYKGGIFEFFATVQTLGSSTVTITVTDSSGSVNSTKTLEVSNSSKQMRTHFTIPQVGATSINVKIARIGSAISVQPCKIQPV